MENKEPNQNTKFNSKLEDLIWIKSNSLDSDLCDLLIKKFEKDEGLKPGTTGNDLVLDVKKTMDLYISNNDNWLVEDDKIFQTLSKELKEYQNYLKSLNPFLSFTIKNAAISDSGYNLQRYDNDQENPGFYHWHSDFDANVDGYRILTFMWYLNDVEIGGETEFMNDFKIKPEKGKIVIFPSSFYYLHRALPPVSDKKWICTGWLYTKLPQ
jgi:hypothetical protein